jgi:hypothetical protein
VVEVIAGGDFAAWAIDVQEDGGDGVVVGGLANLEDEVVDHAGADISWDFLGDDSKEVDLGDALPLGVVSFD